MKVTVRFFLVLVLLTLVFAACTNIEAVTPSLTSTVDETHNIRVEHLGDASDYWNTDWKGRASQLYAEILAVTILYSKTHRYIPGKTDCNDMVVDIWDCLADREIVSLIVVGNPKMSRETFVDCSHTWLMVYSGEGSAVALETTTGHVYTWKVAEVYPSLKQYWEGFVYQEPADLGADFKERW